MIRFRRFAILGLLAACVATGWGCASQEAYRAYTETVAKVHAYRQQPGIQQRFDEHGRLVSQTIIMSDQAIPVSQIKDSEWAAPITTALSLGVGGLSGWAITHELAGAIKATQPNVTTTISSGGHIAGGSLDASSTSTTSQVVTETINEMPVTNRNEQQ